jgi:hypothetical protein
MILEIFDSLPTVDPFLVRDRLEIEDISVNPMYLAISENEWQAIQRHIIQRFRTIIDFAFADEGLDRGGEKLRTLVRKLWVARDVEGLDPIVSALQLPRQDAAAILYAWKGILYYDYKVAHMRSDFDGFAQWLNQDAVPSDAPAAEQQRLIKALREDTAKAFRGTWSGIHQILGDYNKSYDELFVHRRSPAPFINFMRRAHKHFWVLGTHIARADHALDLWDKMTYRHYHRRVRSDVLFQLLQAIHDMQRGAA